MTSSVITALLSLLIITPAILEAVRVDLEPRHQHVDLRHHGATASFLCRLTGSDGLPRPITACEMEIKEVAYSKTLSLLHLNRGNSSQLPEGINYKGAGLESGECGVTMKTPRDAGRVYLLTCRVKPPDSTRWTYSEVAVLHIEDYSDLRHVMTPRHMTALPGSRVNITAVADGGPLAWCGFNLPPGFTEIKFYRGAASPHSTADHLYLGTSVRQGDCGISLLVRENQTGSVVSRIDGYRDGTFYSGSRITSLTVLVAPKNITLSSNIQHVNDSVILFATCHVTDSRPVSNITWLLDGVVVREDDGNEEPEIDEWSKYALQSIRQTLIRVVTEADSGKQLVCRVGHVALPGGTVDSNTIYLDVSC